MSRVFRKIPPINRYFRDPGYPAACRGIWIFIFSVAIGIYFCDRAMETMKHNHMSVHRDAFFVTCEQTNRFYRPDRSNHLTNQVLSQS